ncbi:MAG: 1-deoxy-D-xylulose-5-phosphate synthase [bacterium]|nr:1-deoxy-D-xylulose-5-phosphate synthase [bacterium]
MADYLNMVDSPRDLKKLHPDQLEKLAREMREKIIRVVSRVGGHLSSNLGCVELALAVHYVFDAPNDKIIWDVGHQAYAHKLITGRRDAFATLRQHGGISGFPVREESDYDAFGTGHSGTAISAAAGMARARDLRGSDENIVAIVGDASLCSGTSLEALNDAGAHLHKLIVILNDNEMSISRTVGAMAAYLNRLITTPIYNKIVAETDYILEKIPNIGPRMIRTRKRILESIKRLIVPGALFEEMGFRYFGPVDGHNLQSLLHMLRGIKDSRGPVLLHVITRKGKGYRFAEEMPEEFHSAPPFDVKTGDRMSIPSERSFSHAFGQTAMELAEQDPTVVCITAAMAKGVGLEEFRDKFPRQFIDVGIAEEHAVTMAAGLAVSGYRPIVAVYSTFLQRAFDQILHDVCIQNLPVVFAVDRAGFSGEDGPTHHGVFDLSYLGMMPNMTIAAPRNPQELRDMLHFALTLPGPVAIRYPRSSDSPVNTDRPADRVEAGKAQVLKPGSDVAILAIGSMVETALQAAELLNGEGVSAMVVNARFAKPLDSDLIRELSGAVGHLVTVEENALLGGFGSRVAQLLEQQGRGGVSLLRLGVPDKFIKHGSRELLLKEVGLTPRGIADNVKAVLSVRNHAAQYRP